MAIAINLIATRNSKEWLPKWFKMRRILSYMIVNLSESTITNLKTTILHHELSEGYQLVKNALNILTKISFISVLTARWSVSVLNA